MLKEWLTKYKFKDWNLHSDGSVVNGDEKEKRAIEIAEQLSDNNKWKSHGRPITIETLSNQLNLKIED